MVEGLTITTSQGDVKEVPCARTQGWALLNLTGHELVLGDITVPPSGELARVDTGYEDDTSYGVDFVAREIPGGIRGLPQAIPADTFVVVSAMLWERLKRERRPGCSRVVWCKPATGHPGVLRSRKGQITSVPRLVAIDWSQP